MSRLHLEPDSEDFPIQVDQWTYERHYADALAVLKAAIEGRDRPLRNWQKAYYTHALALLQQFSGDAVGARATWQRVENDSEELRSSTDDLGPAYRLACAYAALGDKTKAFATVDRLEAVKRPLDDLLVRLSLSNVRRELRQSRETKIWRSNN